MTGDETVAVPAAVNAVRRGQPVLVVLRPDDPRVAARLRRLCGAAKSQLTVMANAEVVCVDGVDGVEAVVVRYTRSRRRRISGQRRIGDGHPRDITFLDGRRFFLGSSGIGAPYEKSEAIKPPGG